MSRHRNDRESDALLESLESMQKAIDHVRAQLDSLPRRAGGHTRRAGLRATIHEHPVATACAAVVVLMLLAGVTVWLLRHKR